MKEYLLLKCLFYLHIINLLKIFNIHGHHEYTNQKLHWNFISPQSKQLPCEKTTNTMRKCMGKGTLSHYCANKKWFRHYANKYASSSQVKIRISTYPCHILAQEIITVLQRHLNAYGYCVITHTKVWNWHKCLLIN